MSYAVPVTTVVSRQDACVPGGRPAPGAALPELDAAGIAAVCQALGSPVRLRLLAVIQAAPDGGACVCELVDAVGLAQSTVSHHLGVLVASGLVRREQRGTWAWYRLVPDRLAAARELVAHVGLPIL